MRIHKRPAQICLTAFVSLFLLTFLAVLPAPGRDIPLTGPGWERYQNRLRSLRSAPPKGELLRVYKEIGHTFRRVGLWVKAKPPKRSDSHVVTTLEVYVDDDAGNRVRTAPDEVLIELQQPTRVSGEARVRTSDGHAAVGLLSAAEWPRLGANVWAMPWAAEVKIRLPEQKPEQAPFAALDSSRIPMEREAAARQAEHLLALARETAARGRHLLAGRVAFDRGVVLLAANDTQGALEAFELAEREYQSPLAVWGQVQLLRKLGRAAEANRKAEALVKKYPHSIPAEFVNPAPGEIWWTPYNRYFGQAELPAAR